VGPKADSKGPRVSTPEQTERVGVVGSPNQEPRATSAWTALWEAIASDDADAVRALFQSRPFAARRVLTQQNPRGRTPLYYAVTRAANNERLPLDIVHVLLDHGADLDRPAGKSRDNLYTTARKRAMASDREDLVALVRNQALKIALRKSGW
jgi:ankyrin repeat protein